MQAKVVLANGSKGNSNAS